jgi:KDO2-lipid IV(A) lauroyltransferase
MFNYLLYRIGQFVALIFPLKISYRIAVLASDIHYFFVKADRKIVQNNLRAVFPQMPKQELNKVCINTFRNFAKYLVDFFRADKIDRNFIKNNVVIENQDYLEQSLAKGKGVIILSAHLGNWELGGMAVALLGYPFWAVAMQHKDKNVNKFFNAQRQGRGVKVIPLGNAVRQCLKVLKNNELLALIGDRDFAEKGSVVDFFGKPTIFPEGPAEFSRKIGAVIVPVFMLRNPDDSFILRFEKPLDFASTPDKANDLKRLIGSYKLIFEDYIKNYPDQWCMFRRFWKE